MLRAEIAKMPKVELHRHLEGSIRLSTLLELTRVPNAVASSLLLTQPMESLTQLLELFWAHQDVLNSPSVIERVAFEVVEDAAKDNIKILELRYSPFFVAINHASLSFEAIHSAVVRGVRRGEEEYGVVVGLIGIIDRMQSQEEATMALDFFLRHRLDFLALDLANDENKYPALPFAPLFERARMAGMSITIHAGETLQPSGPGNVFEAVDSLKATRIGHGIMAIKDAHTLQLLRHNRTVLEVCPRSNYLCGLVPSLEEHPLKKLLAEGIACTISTDDPGLFGHPLGGPHTLVSHTLNQEYLDIVRAGLMTLDQLRTANQIAYEASFLPLAIKAPVWTSS